MFKKNHNFTLQDIEKTFVLKSWWAALAILPSARRLGLFICNYTNITPNALTLVAFGMKIISAGFFLNGTHPFLVGGALLYQLSYLLDCIDGTVARLKNMTSPLGRYLDHTCDLISGVINVLALGYGQGMLTSPYIIGILFAHISIYYITYTLNLARGACEANFFVIERFRSLQLVQSFCAYREFFFQRNFKSFFSFPDYEALMFFIFPILGYPILGITICFYIVILFICYEIFSSFVTLHTGGSKFP